MNNATILWLAIAIIGIFLVFIAWKKGKIKGTDYKGIFYLGLIFTVVGLFEKFRYHEWGFLPIGLLFLLVGWINKKKWKKSA